MQTLRYPDSSTGAEQMRNSHGYSEAYQSVLERLDREDKYEEISVKSDKQRRLHLDQVHALETNFEMENKLNPGRKLQLARELGLQPRQVAIWFQNRRARYKSKLLERDYGVLKANYDALRLSYANLEHEREALSLQLKELKENLRAKVEGSKNMVEGNVNSPPSSVSFSNSINGVSKSCHESQVFRMEDQSLYCLAEPRSFFAVDQAPTLQWSFQD